MSVPQSAGHIPVFYNYVNSAKGINRRHGTLDKPGLDYVFSSTDPLFPFGFGLSYTTFKYDNLKVSKTQFNKNDQVTISVDVKNTGSIAGKEVVQLYLGNKVNSVSTPVMALSRFSKISLDPGEVKTVTFNIGAADIAIWNRNMKLVTEPGTFDVMIARSAEDVLLKKQIEFRL